MTDYRRASAQRRPPEDPQGSPGRPALPDRPRILAALTEVLDSGQRRWAWQGTAGAAQRWLSETGPKDLDLWYAASTPSVRDERDPAEALCRLLPGARVAAADDPGRLRHTSLSIETAAGPAVVDLTRGDLRVGPILLVPADEVDIDPATRHLTGAAAVADLLVRPVLRGRLPGPERLAEARIAWRDTPPARRAALRRRLAGQLGESVAAALTAVASGARPDPGLPRRARLRLVARSLTPANAPATWAQRRTVWPAGRAAGPLGLRVRGVVVALVGTDGSGKSTLADGLHERLHRYGLPTSAAYFGMARGNLPGVGLARRLLGVGSVAPSQDSPAATGPAAAARPALDHPHLRRAAAWFYAGEYVWRYLRFVAGPRARRHVVIVDRWVYDLRESPWPGSRAARLAERLLPDPDLVVLPDAPIELIHRRKPERSPADQGAQQERFRRLLAEHPASHAELVVDTSGATADPLAPVVAAVVEAAHGPRRRAR